jgi:hypothetical protein
MTSEDIEDISEWMSLDENTRASILRSEIRRHLQQRVQRWVDSGEWEWLDKDRMRARRRPANDAG